MRILLTAALLTAFLGGALPSDVEASEGRHVGSELVIVTQNQYLGADLDPLVNAPDLPAFEAAAEAVLLQIAANNFPDRADALAESIASRLPDIVGLQEVFNFTVDVDGDGPIPPTNGLPPFVDHLAETLASLADLGVTYVPVASVQNLNVSIPNIEFQGLGPVTIGVTDRDVILVRGDLAQSASVIPFSLVCARPSQDGGPGCNYQAFAAAPTPIGDVIIERGFIGVDVLVDNKLHRVINTHLEIRRPDGSDSTLVIQALQAAELIQTLQATPNPYGANVIVIGDINSDPDDPVVANPGPLFIPPFQNVIVPPFTQLVSAGYTDAWALRPGATTGRGYVTGDSCCQLNDLSNHQSELDRRVDVIFSSDQPNRVTKARVLGDRVSDKTPNYGLWPSDHGSVAAGLQFD